MIIVYTPMAEDAVLMAAALGGIQNQKRSTLNFAAAKEELQELMTLYSKNGFISGYVGSEDAIFTWGDSLLREKEENFLQNEASKFAYEASYAPCSDQVEQAEIVSKLFSSPKHEIIYDASLHPGDQNFQILCSYSGAENKAHHKITIEEMTEDGIQAAFEKPMGMQETKAHMMSEKNRIYTKNAAAKMLNESLPKELLPGESLSLAALTMLFPISERCLQHAKPKSIYLVNGQILTPSKTFPLIGEFRENTFSTQKKAQMVAESLPSRATICSLSEAEEVDSPPGPHSFCSLLQRSAEVFDYSPSEVTEALHELFRLGFITNPYTDSRKFKKDSEAYLSSILKMLALTPRYGKYLAEASTLKAEESFFQKEKKQRGGIICTLLPLDTSVLVSPAAENVYMLICNELLKVFYSSRIIRKKKAVVAVSDLLFNAEGGLVMKQGYRRLAPAEPINDFPSEFKEGTQVRVSFSVTLSPESVVSPYKRAEMIRKISEENPLFGAPNEVEKGIEQLISCGLLSQEDNSLFITPAGEAVVRILSKMKTNISDMCSNWSIKLENIEKAQNIETAAAESSRYIAALNEELEALAEEISGQAGKETKLTCPKCGKNLYKSPTLYFCRECHWEADNMQFGRKINEKEMQVLLKNKTTPVISGFMKGNKEVRGRIYLTERGEIKFTQFSVYACPACKKGLKVSSDGKRYFCSDKNCGFSFEFSYFGHTLTRDEIKMLLTELHTHLIDPLVSSQGSFAGFLYIDPTENYKVKCLALQT